MKIKKLNESKINDAEEAEVVVINADDSKAEAEKKLDAVADAADVVLSAEEESDFIDVNRKRNLKVGRTVVYGNEKGLGVKNAITQILDIALKAALKMRDNNGTKSRANIRISGLPGSGKTASVYD